MKKALRAVRARDGHFPERIAALYAVVGAAWVLFSDELVDLLAGATPYASRLQTFKGWFFIAITALLLDLLLRRHFADLRRRDEKLDAIAVAVSATSGRDFFFSLVRQLTASLECEFALVGRLEADGKGVVTLAVSQAEEIRDNFRYDLQGTPCAGVLDRGACSFPRQVASQFPDDTLLAEMGIEGYIGVPLAGSRGEVLGILVALFRNPVKEIRFAEATLTLFGMRAAAELERLRADDEMKRQLAEISTIFDSISAVIYVCDLQEGSLLYLNRHGESLYGGSWEGKSCHAVLHNGLHLPCDFCNQERLFEGEESKPPNRWSFRNNTSGRWYQCIDRAITWPTGRKVRMGIAIDISEQRELERVKDEMLSAVSHEMLTPLTAILGFTEFLLQNPVIGPAEREECLETVHLETERLNELIGNFLDLQRMRGQGMPYRDEAVAVAPLLLEAGRHFSFQGKSRISVDVPEDIPPLRGDAERLRQAVDNLVSNAVKYSPPGSTVSVCARLSGDRILISVRDQGPGIPPEALDKIFERFFRVDNTDRRRSGGAGLGLAIVREVADALGGRVWVECPPDGGSIFYLEMPRMNETVTS